MNVTSTPSTLSLLLFFLACILVSSCYQEDFVPREVPSSVLGKRPVYLNYEINDVVSTPSTSAAAITSTQIIDNYIYAQDRNGIHIIDNTNIEFPNSIAFIDIADISAFTVKDGYMYAQLGLLSLVIDISNPLSTTICSISPSNLDLGIFTLVPPLFVGYFECVDMDRGEVVGWISDTLNKPECIRD